jgi:hypothetical protein
MRALGSPLGAPTTEPLAWWASSVMTCCQPGGGWSSRRVSSSRVSCSQASTRPLLVGASAQAMVGRRRIRPIASGVPSGSVSARYHDACAAADSRRATGAMR